MSRTVRAALCGIVVTAGVAGIAAADRSDARKETNAEILAPATTTVAPDALNDVATGPFAPAEKLPGGPIDFTCVPPSSVPAAARQVVVVEHTDGSSATLDLLVFENGRWVCELRDVPAKVGRAGVRPLAERRSGDDTTPAGVFALGETTAPDGETFQFFGNGANPGVPGSWHQVDAGDCWVARPGVAAYNTLVSRSAAACTSPDEFLPSITGAYSMAALIGANMGPDRSGDSPSEPPLAAAIFLHRHAYDSNSNPKGTSGCVSLPAEDLATVLTRLRPGEAWFVID